MYCVSCLVLGEQPSVQRTQLQLILEPFLVTRPYYPCCVLAHPDIRCLQQINATLRDQYSWLGLSIGTALSAALRSVAPPQRAGAVYAALAQAIRPLLPGPILCTDIDLLFEPMLALDPLRLLRDTSRLAPLVVLWPGTVSAARLTYAVPQHAHYRSWSRPDVMVVSLEALSFK